jgi:phosphoribosylaminoimidazole-succinocarboxamide synthase
MSKFWFDLTKDIVPNHMISVDVKDMPEFFHEERFDGNSMMCKKLEMLPIECIVRGYITGSGWESYKENGTVCGIKLPEGLQESDKLPEPIFTPSTKAEIGLHDENISFERCREILEKEYPGKGASYAEQIKPEFRHLSQNRTLFCDFVLQNMIESRNSVCRYNDQAVAVIIYFTYFSLFNWLKYFATHPLCPLFRCYKHHIIF